MNVKHVSGTWNPDSYSQDSEVVVREIFLQASRDTLDAKGITKETIMHIEGMMIMLKRFERIDEESANAKIKTNGASAGNEKRS